MNKKVMFQLVIAMSNGGIKFPHTQRIVATITKEFSPYVDSFAAKDYSPAQSLVQTDALTTSSIKNVKSKKKSSSLGNLRKILDACLLFSNGLRKQLLIVIQNVKVPKHLLKYLLLITPITLMTRNYLVTMLMTLLNQEIIDALLFVQPA